MEIYLWKFIYLMKLWKLITHDYEEVIDLRDETLKGTCLAIIDHRFDEIHHFDKT